MKKIHSAALILALALGACKGAPVKKVYHSIQEHEAAIDAARPKTMSVKVGQELRLSLGPVGSKSGPFYKLDGYSPLLRDVLRERTYPAFEDGEVKAVLLALKPGTTRLKILKKDDPTSPSWNLHGSIDLKVLPAKP